MADDINKDSNEANFSIDTLYVLLLVICGLAVIFVVGSLLLKPGNPEDDTITTNLIVPGTMPEENDSLVSLEDSLELSYLREGDKEDEKAEDSITEDIKPIMPEEELKTETPSIYKKPVTVVKKDPVVKKPIIKPVVKRTQQTKSVIKKAPAVKKRKKLVTVQAYWIQVGSFSTSAKAKQSVDTLKARGLSSRVVLKNINGKSLYRVRIGAYETKGEADKFCEEVKKVPGYSDSYVSKTTTQRYITY